MRLEDDAFLLGQTAYVQVRTVSSWGCIPDSNNFNSGKWGCPEDVLFETGKLKMKRWLFDWHHPLNLLLSTLNKT